MDKKAAQDEDARYIATDPSDLAVGDRVAVKDVGDDGVTRGKVQAKIVEAGRYCIEVRDGDDEVWSVWEQAGRTFTKIEREA